MAGASTTDGASGGGDRVVVFSGTGAGEGPLTWGQQTIWQVMRIADSSRAMGAVVPLTDGRGPDDLAAELEFFLSRFGSMRTRLRFGAGDLPTQETAASGEAVLRVVEAADDADPEAVGAELLESWQATKFDYENEWPVRMAAIRHRGATTHVVVALSHLAADATGAMVMMRELAERDPVTGAPATSEPAISPLALAARQAEAPARRISATSLRYWERVIRGIAPDRFAGRPAPGPAPRFRQLSYASTALHMATRVVASRTGGGAGPVVLAAYAVLLTQISGVDPAVILGVVGNRFRPGLADAVQPLSQNGILVIDVGADPLADFDVIVDRAQRASLQASKNAYFDPADHAALLSDVEKDRGTAIDLACLFNARGPAGGPAEAPPATAAQTRAAVAGSTLTWGPPMKVFPEKVMLNVDDTGGSHVLLLEADTHFVSAEQMEAMLRGIEALVIEAAFPAQAGSR